MVDGRSNEPDSTLKHRGNSEGETIKELYPCLKPNSVNELQGWL